MERKQGNMAPQKYNSTVRNTNDNEVNVIAKNFKNDYKNDQ
jgi:hypothetical protein